MRFFICSAVFVIIGVTMVGQTLYDGYLQFTNSSKFLHISDLEAIFIGFTLIAGPASGLYVSFSVISNGKKLLAVSRSPEQFHCLHGIRWLSMMWVVLGHQIMYSPLNQAVYNYVDIKTVRNLTIWSGLVELTRKSST